MQLTAALQRGVSLQFAHLPSMCTLQLFFNVEDKVQQPPHKQKTDSLGRTNDSSWGWREGLAVSVSFEGIKMMFSFLAPTN